MLLLLPCTIILLACTQNYLMHQLLSLCLTSWSFSWTSFLPFGRPKKQGKGTCAKNHSNLARLCLYIYMCVCMCLSIHLSQDQTFSFFSFMSCNLVLSSHTLSPTIAFSLDFLFPLLNVQQHQSNKHVQYLYYSCKTTKYIGIYIYIYIYISHGQNLPLSFQCFGRKS